MDILDTENDLEEILCGIRTEELINDLEDTSELDRFRKRRPGTEQSLARLKSELETWTTKVVRAQQEYDSAVLEFQLETVSSREV